MQPFLFLGSRAEDRAADEEYAAMLLGTGLQESMLHRRRLEAAPLGDVDPGAYAGVILGGGPFNISDLPAAKSRVQQRVELEVQDLLDLCVSTGLPFLGCCYGMGPIGVRDGGVVGRTYAEPIGPVSVSLTPAGRSDPLFEVLPERFEAYVGHKEAVTTPPAGAVVLASSPTCPVQAMRLGEHVYATQFHPELDYDGIATRIEVYADYGYFEPSEADAIKARCRAGSVTEPVRLLRRFVELYDARPAAAASRSH